MACTLYQGKLFIAYPYLKKVTGILDKPEKIRQLASDLENATKETFKRIERAKRQTLIDAQKYYVD